MDNVMQTDETLRQENVITATKDESFDPASLLTRANEMDQSTVTEEPTVPKQSEKPQSALDRAIEEKNKVEKGVLVDADKEVVGPNKLRPTYDSDDSRAGFAEEISEQQALITKATMVYVTKRPEDQKEYAEIITEISGVTIGDDGVIHVPEGARYIIPKNPEVVALVEAQKQQVESGELIVNDKINENPAEAANYPAEFDPDKERREKKNQLVKILIDKTGLGANIKFDNEENKVIETSNMIHLVEVENKEHEIVDIDRIDDSTPFLQAVDTYQLSVSKAPMTFPASGFKADMCGLSWGEFSDITMDISDDSEDYINFDKIYKKLSVIYNKMKNISIGAFENFEAFLKHFAYVDVQLATYGLLIATQPEKDTITLTCNKEGCKKHFNFEYVPRSIIDFNSANSEMLEMIDKINSVMPEERLTLAKNSRVNKFRRFRLPKSGYLIDLGFASCYDYLYGILSLIKEYTEKELPGDDPHWELTGMLQGLRAIYIPQANGKYAPARKPADIIEVLNDAIPPEDIVVLNAAYEHYVNQYYIGFSLKNIVCPHCKTKTERIAITPDELVFLIHQRQRATTITFDNFQDF